jgi:hypothetical protein
VSTSCQTPQLHETLVSVSQVVTCGKTDRHDEAKRHIFETFHYKCTTRGCEIINSEKTKMALLLIPFLIGWG